MELDRDLEEWHGRIMLAQRPEDLFGSDDVVLPVAKLLKFLDRQYEPLRAAVEPARYSDVFDIEAAEDATRKLKELYAEAQRKIARFHYALHGYDLQRPALTRYFDVGANRYFVGARSGSGEYSTEYQGYLERDGQYLGEVVIELASSPSKNHYLERAIRSIDLLHRNEVPQWKHLPLVHDRFESGGRLGVVFRKRHGISLSEVRKRQAQRKGVDQRHLAWMLDRSLSCLGYVHRCGIVHGEINPDNLVIDERSHNVMVRNWCRSVHNPAITGERIDLGSAAISPFVAPEVREVDKPGPWSDIFSLGKTAIWLLGGDPTTDAIPDRVESQVSSFLLRMVQEDCSRRSADCWELYEEHCRIRDDLWPRKFLHFDIS